jgi:hypothetical protein
MAYASGKSWLTASRKISCILRSLLMTELESLAQPVAVVCHDAGAANIVLAEMRAAPKVKFLPVMQGPAEKLWVASGFHSSALLTPDDALAQAASALTGTGWASDVEHEARRSANELGLRSVAVLDHWVNYPARFERHGQVALPDELWVTDRYAFDMAAACFIGQQITQRPNLYLQEQVKQITPLSASTGGHLLYVLEPLRFSWPGCRQPAEFEALDFFTKNLSKITTQETLQIRLRPHPSDAEGKYTEWLNANAKHNITLDTSSSLSEAIGRVEWVAGCETAAMVVALASGRKVLATLPTAAPKCRLPHGGIVHLRDLV